MPEALNKFQNEVQHRSFSLGKKNIDEEARTVDVAFSSEDPYLRFFGYEILDHDASSVRLGRLQSGGAVLVDHDSRDHVGVVESVKIDSDRVGRATLRFGRSARSQEVFTDVVDGIRKSISVGYRVHAMTLESEREGEEPVYRVSDWEPFEISFVAIPADSTVGVGRSSIPYQSAKEDTMSTESQVAETRAQDPAAPAVAKIDVAAERDAARKEELTRIREIEAIGKQFGCSDLADEFVSKGHNVEQFRQAVLAKMAEDNEAGAGAIPEVGLSEREADRYSFIRAMAALANPDNARLRKSAAFEFEVSEAAQEASGRRSMGFMVPPDVLKRDLTVGTATAGGHTVETELRGLIDILRNRSVINQVGAMMLTGLQGNVAFPRQTGAATGYWVAEGGAPTESQQSFDQVPLTPKTYGAFTEYSRQLLLQTSLDIEGFVRNDLARVLALGIDLASLYGSGAANQPTGVSNQAGINAPTAFASANPTFAEIVAMESAIAADNADEGTMAYVCRTDMRGHFKSTEKFTNTGQTIWEPGNTVNGYNVGVSNQVTAGDLFFGNWQELIIGMWGGLDIMVNPYALDTSGGIRIVALQSMDIAVRHPVSFAFNNDGV